MRPRHPIRSRKVIVKKIAAMSLGVGPAIAQPDDTKPTIVLVHGAFVDGSGCAGVHRILNAELAAASN